MKITYLKLKNFSTIYSAMKRREIEIDLSKSTNRVFLLIGRNGTGKTSLLSQFHPFAFPGTMDVRNGSSLILEGQDGYKEIHIKKDDDLYEIKHYYLYKSNKGVKSYISKNGKELNPNGNVTSFKEAVAMELSLEQDYLKLIRLGPNVKNFIKMSASERKSFTTELLNDIDVYSKYFRKISDDSRVLKSLLKSVIDKIDKLKIYDEKEEIERLNELEKHLKLLKDNRDKLTSEIGQIDGSINVLASEGLETFILFIKEKESVVKELISNINQLDNKLNKDTVIILGDIDSSIKNMEKELMKNENKIESNKNMIDFYFNKLNTMYEQKREKEDSLKYVSTELEYSKLTELFLELNREKSKLDKKFKNFNPKCTKDEMLQGLGLLQEIDKFISDIYEFDTKAIKDVVNHLLNNDNIEYIVKKEVTRIDDRMSKINFELNKMNESLGIDPNTVYVLYKPTDCDCVCPFQKFYEDVMKNKKSDSREKLKSELESLEHKREFFLSFTAIQQKIDYILLLIKTNKKLIEKMPENFFDIKHILNCIKDFKPFYNEDYITDYISLLEEYEYYNQLDERIKEVHKEKSFIEKNSNSLTSLQKDLEILDKEIFNTEKELNSLKDENENLNELNKRLLREVSLLKNYKELMSERRLLEERLEKEKKELEKLYGTKEKITELLTTRKELNVKLAKTDEEINKVENQISDIRFKLKEFKDLNEEKTLLEEKFDDINIIKEALSSNKGIPLLFIQLYLRNTRLIVNQLLDLVFKGELEIGDFIINDKEFKIPYIKNGIMVEDVVHCSQGEESFISLALSFALIEQSIKEYNILLLDEIDATLDITNRYMFLTILEKQLDSINAEQVFLITHNNMFDNYPVDIIMTSDERVDNLKNANIIFKA